MTARQAASGRRAQYKMQRGRMPVPQRLLARRFLVDRIQRQIDFNQLAADSGVSGQTLVVPNGGVWSE